jgi:uncharacterized protein YbcI
VKENHDPVVVANSAGSHTHGTLGASVSNAIVRLLHEHAGKGPNKCKTYFDDDLVVVLLRGGGTVAEQTMFQAGKWVEVREARHALHDSMAGKFSEAIEGLTNRHVVAFMSASHQDPDLTIETFLLDREVDFTAVETPSE